MTTASRITLIRIVIIPVFMVFMYIGGGASLLWSLLSLAIFVAASVTDFIDGYIARRFGQITDFGKFLDPLADKLLTISAMCIFCQWGRFPAWALMIVLAREFSVTGLRLIAVQKGNVIAAGWSGKVKTASTMIGICAIIVFSYHWLDIAVISLIVITTVYSGIEYFVKNWNVLWDLPRE